MARTHVNSTCLELIKVANSGSGTDSRHYSSLGKLGRPAQLSRVRASRRPSRAVLYNCCSVPLRYFIQRNDFKARAARDTNTNLRRSFPNFQILKVRWKFNWRGFQTCYVTASEISSFQTFKRSRDFEEIMYIEKKVVLIHKALKNCSRHIWRKHFYFAEDCSKRFADLLHSYCLGENQYIQAFVRPQIFYYSASFSGKIALEMNFLNAENGTAFETACKYVVNPTFSILHLNLWWSIKHFNISIMFYQ